MSDVTQVLGQIERGDGQAAEKLLALVAGIIGTTWGLVRAEKARQEAHAAQLTEADRAEGERRAKDEAQQAWAAERRAREGEATERRRAEEAAKAERRAREAETTQRLRAEAAAAAERKAREDEALQRRRAEAARLQAELKSAESQDRLVRHYVANGVGLVEQGDLLRAIPWFTQALKEDRSDPAREQTHRIRLATLLQQAPRLRQIWFHDLRANHALLMSWSASPKSSPVRLSTAPAPNCLWTGTTTNRGLALAQVQAVAEPVPFFSRLQRLVAA